MNTNDLKIKQAVLKAVREISKAAFDKGLGDYCINFTLAEQISVLSMSLFKGLSIYSCFKCFYTDEMCGNWQTSFPLSVEDIPRFQVDVEKGLAEIFEYVKANHDK